MRSPFAPIEAGAAIGARCSLARRQVDTERAEEEGAAVGDFYILSRLAGEDAEALGRRGDVGAEGRAGKHLAVATVADVDGAWLHVRFVR